LNEAADLSVGFGEAFRFPPGGASSFEILPCVILFLAAEKSVDDSLSPSLSLSLSLSPKLIADPPIFFFLGEAPSNTGLSSTEENGRFGKEEEEEEEEEEKLSEDPFFSFSLLRLMRSRS